MAPGVSGRAAGSASSEGSVPRVADPNEIADLGWFAFDALPRPESDFTVRRIDDALSGATAAVHLVTDRKWLEA